MESVATAQVPSVCLNQMHVLTRILKNKTEHRTTNKLKYLKEQKAEISALLMIELSWDLYID